MHFGQCGNDMWISSKVSRAKAPKNGRLPKKAAIIHKIPEFVGDTADFRRRSFSFERKRKKKIIFLPPFII
ncbi:hypothetical protein DW140_09590 [Escherichia coli]|nr:hypothetical protein DW140_09590 [Escherichia coli]TXU15402.1 hypothetical protein D4N03_02605 [Escherichia coli]